MTSAYATAWTRAADDPESFWAEVARAVDWTRTWDEVLDQSRPPFARWFGGAETNTCWNAVDRHVAAGHGGRPAILWDSPVTGSKARITYADLLDRVARVAGGLAGLGVTKGDRVLLYMPMVPEAVVAMLACARLGAIHSVVFGGFAAAELKTRIDDAQPKVIVAASCGVEPGRLVAYKPLLDAALAMTTWKPDACVYLRRTQLPIELGTGDRDWADLASADPVACVPVGATDPLYILYTSGTTGIPKGVVRDTGGHLVALAWAIRNVFDIGPGDVFWTASDVGWVVGHSFIVYAPLIAGATTVLYEGKPIGTPDAGAFWRVIAEYGVKALFTAPTAFRAIRREDPEARLLAGYDLSRFRTLFLAGERCDPETLKWAEEKLKVPVIDNWWQTETGWPICANPMGLERMPVKPGSPTRPMPGWRVKCLDTAGEPVAPGETGSLVLELPLPPGALPTLWNNDTGFVASYLSQFPGHYSTGDAGVIDADGYVFVMSRTDDIINVAGHRLSTGGMEEVLATHPDVAECAVIGVADPIKGQVPLGFLTLKAGVSRSHDTIAAEAVKLIRDRIGPVAAFKTAVVVARLPKTRSGKILRGTMRGIADQTPWKMPATIDDPAVLGEIASALKTVGYAGEG